jgi:hypothetical protein
MLHLLDESLESFLRAKVPLSQREVDVVFEAPDGDWAAGISRPTVNLYLWDVRPNLSEREWGEELLERDDGKRYRRDPLPRVDCRYLVTAWTTDVRDEHSLLGNVLGALLLHPLIEEEYLQGAFTSVRPTPRVHLRTGDGTENSDFWSALGGQLKPGLDLVVTATVDAALMTPAGPPVEEVVPSAVRMKKPRAIPSPRTVSTRTGEKPSESAGRKRSRAPK